VGDEDDAIAIADAEARPCRGRQGQVLPLEDDATEVRGLGGGDHRQTWTAAKIGQPFEEHLRPRPVDRLKDTSTPDRDQEEEAPARRPEFAGEPLDGRQVVHGLRADERIHLDHEARIRRCTRCCEGALEAPGHSTQAVMVPRDRAIDAERDGVDPPRPRGAGRPPA
jgi:hypothetical protein